MVKLQDKLMKIFESVALLAKSQNIIMLKLKFMDNILQGNVTSFYSECSKELNFENGS